MEMIRIYNYNTNEVLEKTFASFEEADGYENILIFLGASYERFLDGEKV